MSMYFEKANTNINETIPHSPSNENVAAPGKDVSQYFNPTQSAVPASDSKSSDDSRFTSDGLIFQRLKGSNTVQVVGLAAATSASHVVIPSYTSFLNLKVTQIGRYAFHNATKVRTISLPATVTAICDYAFAGSTLEFIGLLPSVTALGRAAFAGCANLRNVDLSEASIKEIARQTFENCSSLTSIIFPKNENFMGIYEGAFENCYSLEEVSLPESTAILQDNVFKHCKNLRTISFGNSISSIGKDVFTGCKLLAQIVEPNEYIRDNAQMLFEDTSLFKNAEVDSLDCKSFMKTLIHMDPDSTFPPFDTQVISSFALVDSPEGATIHLPKTLRLLMPNALVQPAKIKKLDEKGTVQTVDGYRVKVRIEYEGTISEWFEVQKIYDKDHRYPILITCKKEEGLGMDEVTFVDYV